MDLDSIEVKSEILDDYDNDGEYNFDFTYSNLSDTITPVETELIFENNDICSNEISFGVKLEEDSFLEENLSQPKIYSIKSENVDFGDYIDSHAGYSGFELSGGDIDEEIKSEFESVYIKEEPFNNAHKVKSEMLSSSIFQNSKEKITRFFVCCFCDFKAVEKSDLKSHIEDIHREYNKAAPTEPGTFAENNGFDVDDSSFFPPPESKISRFFVCCFCNFRVVQIEDLKTHIEVVHLKLKPFSCSLCDFKTIRNNILCHHVLTVHLKNFECSHCDFKSSRKQLLKTHIDRVHLKVFSCPTCDFKVNHKAELEKHIMRVHLDLQTFECAHCNFSTQRKQALRMHIDKVHLKLFNCTSCDFKSKMRSKLMKHVTTTHSNLKSFVCSICNFKTTCESYLQHHIDVVHLKLKMFRCTICNYSTNIKTHLDGHMKAKHWADI